MNRGQAAHFASSSHRGFRPHQVGSSASGTGKVNNSSIDQRGSVSPAPPPGCAPLQTRPGGALGRGKADPEQARGLALARPPLAGLDHLPAQVFRVSIHAPMMLHGSTPSQDALRNRPKRVLGTLLARIWPVRGGQNGPRSPVSVARKASFQAHPRLFGRFLNLNSTLAISERKG